MTYFHKRQTSAARKMSRGGRSLRIASVSSYTFATFAPEQLMRKSGAKTGNSGLRALAFVSNSINKLLGRLAKYARRCT